MFLSSPEWIFSTAQVITLLDEELCTHSKKLTLGINEKCRQTLRKGTLAVCYRRLFYWIWFPGSSGSQFTSYVTTKITLKEVVLPQKHTENLHTFSHQFNSFLNLLPSLPGKWASYYCFSLSPILMYHFPTLVCPFVHLSTVGSSSWLSARYVFQVSQVQHAVCSKIANISLALQAII